jgi:hypothetical protein
MRSAVRTIPYDREAVAIVADVFQVAATLAPFQLPGGTVYQMTVVGDLPPWCGPGIMRVRPVPAA